MKAFAAFLIFSFIRFSVCIPIEETEHYKKSKIEYYALVAKLNATDPCQLSFKCTNREECVNFPKCKNGEQCPRTKCVPRKLCDSTVCPPGTECTEFSTTTLDLDEYEYPFEPRINYIGNTKGIRPFCVSRKVPSDGNICGKNEILNDKKFLPLGISEKTCTISAYFGLLQPLGGPYVEYCVCKKGFVRDDISGECIDPSKCPKAKPTKFPINFATKKNNGITNGAKTNPKKTAESFRLRNHGASIKAINNMKQKPVNPINAIRRRTTTLSPCPKGYVCSINMKDFPDLVEPPRAEVERQEKAKTQMPPLKLFTNKIFSRHPINYASKNVE